MRRPAGRALWQGTGPPGDEPPPQGLRLHGRCPTPRGVRYARHSTEGVLDVPIPDPVPIVSPDQAQGHGSCSQQVRIRQKEVPALRTINHRGSVEFHVKHGPTTQSGSVIADDAGSPRGGAVPRPHCRSPSRPPRQRCRGRSSARTHSSAPARSASRTVSPGGPRHWHGC